jgi:hypothetical protein
MQDRKNNDSCYTNTLNIFFAYKLTVIAYKKGWLKINLSQPRYLLIHKRSYFQLKMVFLLNSLI